MNNTRIASANSGNYARPWADGNGDLIKEHCNKVFLFSEWENLYIAQAVKNKMCVGDELPKVPEVRGLL